MLSTFSHPRFCQAALQVSQAYGKPPFWLENLHDNANPDATWRTLMLLGADAHPELAPLVRGKLEHPDSRVRAWACFALGQMGDEAGVEKIRAMRADHSGRVRFHAWQALQAIVGTEEAPPALPGRASGRVLISEDSDKGRELLSQVFAKAGFQTACASDVEETLRLALEFRPDVVITDNQKINPDHSRVDNLAGLNLTFDLARCVELRETLLFMLTADENEAIFLWNGGDHHFSKMRFGVEQVVAVVMTYLAE